MERSFQQVIETAQLNTAGVLYIQKGQEDLAVAAFLSAHQVLQKVEENANANFSSLSIEKPLCIFTLSNEDPNHLSTPASAVELLQKARFYTRTFLLPSQYLLYDFETSTADLKSILLFNAALGLHLKALHMKQESLLLAASRLYEEVFGTVRDRQLKDKDPMLHVMLATHINLIHLYHSLHLVEPYLRLRNSYQYYVSFEFPPMDSFDSTFFLYQKMLLDQPSLLLAAAA